MINNELEARDVIFGDAVDGVGVRVPTWIAKKWLGNNESMICGGHVFYLKIKNLGLGIYKVTKAPLTVRETAMVR
jgi:hypothetical protein